MATTSRPWKPLVGFALLFVIPVICLAVSLSPVDWITLVDCTADDGDAATTVLSVEVHLDSFIVNYDNNGTSVIGSRTAFKPGGICSRNSSTVKGFAAIALIAQLLGVGVLSLAALKKTSRSFWRGVILLIAGIVMVAVSTIMTAVCIAVYLESICVEDLMGMFGCASKTYSIGVGFLVGALAFQIAAFAAFGFAVFWVARKPRVEFDEPEK
eukprot:TRINITY_DN3215_c0_g1_i1.p1 TRINITY_DN3215_c0_g1~~TRINITY_DN3215_c0_g1_i1.p1  ORF type:complete len:227 (-),score=37.11 TRINITY_DN3215_c0_g1_i1:24-659(-)